MGTLGWSRQSCLTGCGIALQFLVAVASLGQTLDGRFGVDLSTVSLGGVHDTWHVEHAEVSRTIPEESRIFLAAESHSRFDDLASALIAGGYRHFGPSTISGDVGFGSGAPFLYRSSVEIEGWREMWPHWVPHLSYRYLHFESTDVHLLSPAITHYSPDGEIESRVFLSRNTIRDATNLTYLLRGIWSRTPKLQLGGGVAIGQRIFDISTLNTTDGRGFYVYADGRVRVSPHGFFGMNLSTAAEHPRFRQRTVGFSYGVTR